MFRFNSANVSKGDVCVSDTVLSPLLVDNNERAHDFALPRFTWGKTGNNDPESGELQEASVDQAWQWAWWQRNCLPSILLADSNSFCPTIAHSGKPNDCKTREVYTRSHVWVSLSLQHQTGWQNGGWSDSGLVIFYQWCNTTTIWGQWTIGMGILSCA